jgi:putative membrane protein
MMVSNRGSVLRLLAWQWKSALLFTLFATVTVAARLLLGQRWIALPALPLAVVGGALGIFVSFRTNSAYARWWEGRQLWGRMVNVSRLFASQVMSYLPSGEGGAASPLQRTLLRRHVAYVHVLRCALRQQSALEDPRVIEHLGEEERAALKTERNLGHALVHRQLSALAKEAREGTLNAVQLQSMDTAIAGMLDAQGGCERIKKTPLPRGYAFIAERLILAYALLFPASVVGDLGWITIPMSLLVNLSFTLISEAGRVLEDPFTMFWNGLPLTAITTTIEVDARRRLGDTDLPADVQANAEGILM